MEEVKIPITLEDGGFSAGMKRTIDHMAETQREVDKTGMSVENFAKHMQEYYARMEKLTTAVMENTAAMGKDSQAARQFGKDISDATDKGVRGFGRLEKAAIGFFTLQKAKEFVGKVYDVRSEIERLETSFRVLIGNKDKADALFASIRKFAVETPLQMNDLASAAQTMMGFGIGSDDILANLKALGDVAMGDSQKFQSLALAFSQTSAAGKLMGQDLLQMINAGFNPLDQMSKTTGKSIAALKDEMSKGAISADMVRQAFIDATSEGGKYSGMLEAQSKTMAGAYSNLQGAIDDMLNEIGEKSEGIFATAIDGATNLVKHYEKVASVIQDIVVAYGMYKAALMTANAFEKASVSIKQSMAVQEALLSAEAKKLAAARGISLAAAKAELGSVNLLTVAKIRLTAVTNALTTSMMANPYVMVAMAVAGLCYGIYKLATAEDAETAARRRANEEMQTFQNNLEEQKNKVQSYIHTLQDSTASEYKKAEAWEMLNRLSPSLTEKYSKAELATLDLAEATKQLNEENEKANYEHLRTEVKKWEETISRVKQEMLDDAKYGGNNSMFYLHQLEDAKTQLDAYQKKLTEIDTLRIKMEEANKPLEIRIREANENAEAKAEIYNFYKKAADLAGELKNAHDVAAGTIANSSIPSDYEAIADDTRKKYDAMVSELEDDVEILRKKIAESPASLKLKKELENKEDVLKDLLQMKQMWDMTGATTIPLTFQINFSQVERALQSAQTGDGKNTDGMVWVTDGVSLAGGHWEKSKEKADTRTAAEWRKDAYNSWKSAQKEVDSFWKKKESMDKATFDKEYERLKGIADAAKKDYEKLKGEKKSEKKDPAVEKSRKQKEYLALMEKQRTEQERATRDMELSTSQAEIDAMEDGSKKTLAQITLDFEKRKEEIERGYEDLKQKKIEAAKRLWEANPANKNKVFDAGSVDTGYTAVETKNYESMLASAREEYVQHVKELASEDLQYMYDYLSQYGSMQSQKLAIARSYDQKIADEEDLWRKKALEKEKQDLIDSITSENLVKQLDLGSLFSDYGNILASPLEQTIKKLEEYTKSSAFKSRSIDDQKSIYEAIDNAKKQLSEIGKVSFKTLGENLYEYNNALVAFNSSSEQLQLAAQDVIDSEKALAEARKAAAETTEDVENAEAVRNARASNNAARSRYESAETAYYEAQNRMVSTQRAASDSLSALNNSIESVGNIASAVASGSMKQLWDALGTKTQNRIALFLSGNKSFENALKSMGDILGKQGNGMDFLVGKIKGMTSDILSSGDAISSSDFGERITGLFSELFGNDNSDISKFGKNISKVLSNVFDKAQEEGKDTVDVVEEVGTATVKAISKNGGSIWVMIVGLILDLLDVLKEGIGTLIETLLDSVANAIEGILTEIGSGKFFVRIAEGIGNVIAGIVKGIGNLFSGGIAFGGSNEDEMEERIDELAKANEALTTSIDALKNTIEKKDSSNEMSIEAYQKALQAEQDWEKNQREAIAAKASEYANSGYGFLKLGGKRSFNAHMAGNDWEGWKAFTQALKEHGIDKDVNRNNIWTLTPEEMQILRDFRPSEWASLFSGDGHKNPQDLVNEYIERAGMQESLTSALNEKLTGYSWDGFIDAYKNLLKDLDSTTEDFADHINELISNALIESFVNSDAIKERISNLYDKIAEYAGVDSDGGTTLTESEIEDIRRDNENIASLLTTWRDAAKEAGLIVDANDKESKEYFGNLRDMWLSTLTDMEADAASWSKEITRVMVEDLISNMVLGDDFVKWLEEWKERYKEAVESGDTDAVKSLREELEAMRATLATEAQDIMDMTGYTEMMTEIESVFDDLHSDFLETLMEMDADAEEWSRKITETMVRQLIERNLLNEAFDQKLDEWRTRFENVMADTTLSDSEKEASLALLRAELVAMRESLSAEAQKFLDSLGYSEMLAEKEESPFKNLRQSFLNTLLDMKSDAEDFRKGLEKTLVQDMIERLVMDVKLTVNGTEFDNFDSYLTDWNDRYMSIFQNNDLSKEEKESRLQALIDELVAEREALDTATADIRDRLKEEEVDTTFKDMSDSWISLLMDMDATAEDWAEETGRTMARRIMEEMMQTQMIQPLLDELQAAFDAAMSAEGATWESVLPGLLPYIEEVKNSFGEMQPMVEQILNALGIFKEVEADDTISSLRDDWLSALMDMKAGTQDFVNDIRQLLTKKLVEKLLLNSQFESWLDGIQQKYEEILNSDMDEAKMAAAMQRLATEWSQMAKDMQEETQRIFDLTGWSSIVEQMDSPLADLRSSFVSTLMDMESDAEDFADNISMQLTEAFIDKFVLGDEFENRLQEWQEQYAAIMRGNYSEEDRARLLKELQSAIAAAKEGYASEAQAIHDLMGTGTSTDQSATMNMAEKATYDQFETYLGISVAQQMATLQGNEVRMQILSTLQGMAGITSTDGGETAREIRTLLGTTNEYLLDIKRSNRAMLEQFGVKLDNITNKLQRLL